MIKSFNYAQHINYSNIQMLSSTTITAFARIQLHFNYNYVIGSSHYQMSIYNEKKILCSVRYGDWITGVEITCYSELRTSPSVRKMPSSKRRSMKSFMTVTMRENHIRSKCKHRSIHCRHSNNELSYYFPQWFTRGSTMSTHLRCIVYRGEVAWRIHPPRSSPCLKRKSSILINGIRAEYDHAPREMLIVSKSTSNDQMPRVRYDSTERLHNRNWSSAPETSFKRGS